MEKKQNSLNVNPFHFKDVPLRESKDLEYRKSSQYLTMRDGVKIAVELVLPKNLTSDDRISIILMQTRYWRDYKFRIPFKWFIDEMAASKQLHTMGINRGYGFLHVDVRGTGASFGTRPYPWFDKEVEDGREIIDWIIKQPWSNGNVVAMGGSYVGGTSEYLATLDHSAVKAISPYSNQWDVYTEVGYPGGVYNHFFIRIWGLLGRAIDRNTSKNFIGVFPLVYLFVKGVKPVETDKGEVLLKEAMKQHLSNIYVFENEDVVIYRDDKLIKQQDATADTVSVCMRKEDIEKSKTPFYCLAGWFDGAASDNIISRFMTYNNPMRAVIGAWDHGANRRANPYFHKDYEVTPDKENQIKAWLDFFDLSINGKQPFSEKVLYYYTMGEEKWKMTESWPPIGHSMQRWYFSDNNSMSLSKPQIKTGEDKYSVDFEITSGKGNRWHTHYAQKMYYDKRDKVDQKLLIYDSPPLEKDTEITGHPVITLHLTSTHEDGAIFAYLEDLDDNGKVTFVTDGELRFIHRKVSSEEPPYKIMVPYHSFKRKDSLPLIPSEVAEITFGLLPTSVLIRKGHKLRIAIAGADKDTFNRYPKEGTPTITIKRDKTHASFIDIPVIANENK